MVVAFPGNTTLYFAPVSDRDSPYSQAIPQICIFVVFLVSELLRYRAGPPDVAFTVRSSFISLVAGGRSFVLFFSSAVKVGSTLYVRDFCM